MGDYFASLAMRYTVLSNDSAIAPEPAPTGIDNR